MSRAFCVEFDNAFYHVMSRGLNRQSLFNDDDDFKFFLYLLNQGKEKFQMICHSYCLMHNHYHLYVQTPTPNLSKLMKFLNESYARFFLSKYTEKDGHVFKGRYKRKIVQSDKYSFALSRYIHLNPVKAKMVDHPHDWKWSSYNAFVGRQFKNHFLEIDWLSRQFSKDRNIAKKLIVKYTYEDLLEDWDPDDYTIAKFVLGSKEFFDYIVANYVDQGNLNEDMLAYSEFVISKNLDPNFIFSKIQKSEFNDDVKEKLLIYFLKQHSNLSLGEIGSLVNKKVKTVSKSYSRTKNKLQDNSDLRSSIEKVEVILGLSNVEVRL